MYLFILRGGNYDTITISLLEELCKRIGFLLRVHFKFKGSIRIAMS